MAGGEGLLAAGWEAARSGRLDEAERLGRAALAAEPAGHSHGESAEGWFLLGVACHGQGRPGEAAECYTRAVQLRPDLPEVHNKLGNALCDSGRAPEAVDCFRRALRLRPDLPETHNNLG